MTNEKVYGVSFSKVYPLLVAKAVDKLVDELAKGKPMEKILRG